MKIVEKFTDLDKANAYVSEINEAFAKESAEKKSQSEKAVLLQKDLDKQTAAIASNKAETEKQIEELTKGRDEAISEVTSLSKKLDLQEKHGGSGTLVTIGKKNYSLSGDNFLTKDGLKTAEEVSKDQKFLDHLIKIKSGLLTEIN